MFNQLTLRNTAIRWGVGACVIIILVGCLLLSARTSDAGSPVYLGDPKAGLVSMHAIDHAVWDTLLQKYVDRNGRVDYQSWHDSVGDQQKLDQYLSLLSTASRVTDSATSRGDELALWINAYNAVTVKGILREYPTTSIRNHTAKILGYNIWRDLQLYVGRKPISLDQIEHQVLRKMDEPRIHFAIVCASIGCPRLLDEAYVASRLEDQLTTNAKDFFSRSQNFQYDSSSQRFKLSAILKWFGTDFGDDQAAQLVTISKWLPSADARQAASTGVGSVSYLDYDWNLNDQ